MILYHGTNDKRARLMWQQGIKPRGRRRGNSTNLPSEPRHVYLTDCYALYYAIKAADQQPGSLPAVVEIDTDRLDAQALNADEDALEQTQRRTDGLPAHWTPVERVLHYRAAIGRTTHDWQASLAALGCCTHRGLIPPAAITRVAVVDHRQQRQIMWTALDASPTVSHYRLASRALKANNLWLFGATDLPADLQPADYGESFPPRLRWEFPWPPNTHREGITIHHG